MVTNSSNTIRLSIVIIKLTNRVMLSKLADPKYTTLSLHILDIGDLKTYNLTLVCYKCWIYFTAIFSFFYRDNTAIFAFFNAIIPRFLQFLPRFYRDFRQNTLSWCRDFWRFLPRCQIPNLRDKSG